ncbi:MAG TPA: ATP-binding protein [Candidatus Omnitrophota bacterium]|mgnify:CR=1 FL=1|nr:ATP-binding protein [Candidatus Omnitrophota bacterium]HPS36477.1 ATP-binding protein [Candidatus Omnitrophota bacterium]
MKKKFELLAKSEVLSPFRKELRVFLDQAGWGKKETGEILLAVDETLTNIIRHAYGGQPGRMVVEVDDRGDEIEFVFEDQGRRFDPTQVPLPELPREKPGGLGVHFVRTIMDRVIYDGNYPEGNRLHLIKKKAKT